MIGERLDQAILPTTAKTLTDFLRRAVWTKDEASGTVRQFPAGDHRYAYLLEVVKLREKSPILAVEKSRRMLITWLFLSIYLYDVLTQRNHANFVVSKKLEDAAYLLGDDRMLFIHRHLQEHPDLWPKVPELRVTGRNKLGYELLSCDATGSFVQAVASGADQLRQFTASNVLLDEFAFQDRQEQAWAAIKPTVEGGGHIDMVSTANLGAYMHELISVDMGSDARH